MRWSNRDHHLLNTLSFLFIASQLTRGRTEEMADHADKADLFDISTAGSYTVYRTDTYEEELTSQNSLFPSDPSVTLIDRFDARPGTITGLSYTSSPIPGAFSTDDGDITVVIDRYTDDGGSTVPDGTGAVGSFYSETGDVTVIVNGYDRKLSFDDVEERIREQPNFYSNKGTLTVHDGVDDGDSTRFPGDDRSVLLELGDFAEQDQLSQDELVAYWAAFMDDPEVYASDQVAEQQTHRFEEETIPILYGEDVIDIADTSVDDLDVALLDTEQSIEDWYTELDRTEKVAYKTIPYPFQRGFYKRNIHYVDAALVRQGLEALESHLSQGPETVADSDRFNGTLDWYGHVPDLLDRGAQSEVISTEGEPLGIMTSASYDLDMGLLGLEPYRDELVAHGVSLPGLFDDPERAESTITDLEQLSDAALGRIKVLAGRDLIGFEETGTNEALLYTTNYDGNDTMSLQVDVDWQIESVAVPDGEEDAFYTHLFGQFEHAINRAALKSDNDMRGEFVQFHLYEMYESAIDGAEQTFEEVRQEIQDSMVGPTLRRQTVNGSSDLTVAINEYVDGTSSTV